MTVLFEAVIVSDPSDWLPDWLRIVPLKVKLPLLTTVDEEPKIILPSIVDERLEEFLRAPPLDMPVPFKVSASAVPNV